MRLRLITVLVCGIVAGAIGTIVVSNAGRREPQAQPTIPHRAIPQDSHGHKYYIVPLANYAAN